jgi:rRNA maturation RNase YbeY
LDDPATTWTTTVALKTRSYRVDEGAITAIAARVREALPRGLARRASRRRPAGPPPVLGDVVISLPDAARNARRIGQSLDREVAFLLVHGILHLAGHDHLAARDEKKMLAAQRALMRRLARGKGGRPLWTRCAAPRRKAA